MPFRMDGDHRDAFDAVLPAIAKFKKVFRRDLSPDFVAELYVARELDLTLPDRRNEPGADATDPAGRRYEIKYRSPSTLNVDINSFEFDYLVLVNVDEQYALTGMWVLSVMKAKTIFKFRPNFRKHQATQPQVKREATRIR